MKPIDTKTWKEFKIGDLFDVNQVNRLTFPGKSYVKDSEIISKDGTTPYIVATSTNNGIKGYSSYPANNEGDCITMSTTADSSATVFYQPNPFIGRQQMAGLYRKDKKPMGLYLGQFFVSGTKKVLTNYNYTNKLTITALKQNCLILPIQQTLDPDKTYHPDGYIPDWNYMEAFMEQINQQAQARLDEYKGGKLEYTTLDSKIGYTPVDTESWAEFKVGDLFETNNEKAYTGASVKRENLIPGETPRVTVSNVNNGITGYYEDIEDTNYRVYNNFISVSFLGTVFYHPYSASVDMKVHVLPKLTNGRELTTGIGLFLVSAIKASIKRYTYANQISSKVIYDTYIQLPVDQTGQPDWNYMEAFMEQINQQAQARLDEYKGGKLEYTTLDSKIGYTPVDTESWAEFKVGDLFEKLDLKCKKTDFQKNNDLSKIKTDEFNLPLVNAKQGNNGIMYYGREEDWEYAEMTIDIVSDGAVSVGNGYPQPHKTGILYNAYLIKPLKKDVTENHLSFLATVIEKYVKQKYSYENKCIWKKLSLDKIQLPIDSTGQPDWNYMESFMKQINQQAQTKLQQLEKGSI